MKNRGHIRLQRGWLSHPMLGGEPYCKRAAWAWLVEHAAWKRRAVNIRGRTITVQRGQLAASQRYLAVAWKWDRASVRRFLMSLYKEGAIDPVNASGETIITICNYTKYQADPNPIDPPNSPPAAHQMAQKETAKRPSETQGDRGFAADGGPPNDPERAHQTAQIRKKDIEEGKNAAPSGAAIPNGEIELFERGKSILGNSASGLIAKLLKAKNGNIPLARAALEMASTKQSPREYVGAIVRGAQEVDPLHDPFMATNTKPQGIVIDENPEARY
jgi:hypothetical protein